MQENKQQMQAILHGSGPCMVLAGPGSGKTTVITKRVCHLVDVLKIPPEKILVITFTRAAAEEMKTRFARLYGSSSGVSFGTFHALFFKIIKYAYRYDSSSILTEEERFRFINDEARRLKIEGRDAGDFTSLISGEISQCKNNEIDPAEFHSTIVDARDFKALFDAFCSRLTSEGKLDFDDMMLKCLQLFQDNRDILQYWQDVYEYILIDEFQDICPLQYKLIKLLAEPQNNLFIVGDDDQSIYAFRGAEPQICFEFEKEFRILPDYEKISLGVNYRCGSKIVEASARLISNNKKRFKKLLEAGRKGILEDSGNVTWHCFPDLNKQNEYVSKMIRMIYEMGTPLSEIAVLYRTNTQPGNLLSVLRKENIPFMVRDSIRNIYEHWISKNILSYLRLAQGYAVPAGQSERNGGYAAPAGQSERNGGYAAPAGQPERNGGYAAPAGQPERNGGYAVPAGQSERNVGYAAPAGQSERNGGYAAIVSQYCEGQPLDRNDLLSIINRPKRYISRECMRRENVSISSLYEDNRGREYVREKLDKLRYDLGILSKLNPYAGIRYIRKAVGYEDFLKEYSESRQVDYEELLAVLDELEDSAKSFYSVREWEKYILDYTEQLKKAEKDRRKTDNQEAVHFLTFHSAKGLEFDVVFIVDVCEDFMPYWQAETAAQLEEERRMFYVAMTRARKRLYLLTPRERFGRNFEESRFIKECGIE